MNNPAARFARNGVRKPYTSKMKFMTRHHDVYDILSVLLNKPRRVVACCAEVLQYFTRWDEWKRQTQRSPWIYKPLHQIEADLRAYSIRIIRYAISLLMGLGILERRNNPGSRVDRAYQYRIHLDKLKTTDPADDQQGVGGRVWGVGEGEDGDFHPNLPKDSTTTDSLAKNLCTTPHTPYPTPGAPIPPHPSSEDGVSWARLDKSDSTTKHPKNSSLAEEPCDTLFLEEPEDLVLEEPEDLVLEEPEDLVLEEPEDLALEKPEDLALEEPEDLALEEPFCDTLFQEELISNDLPLNELSSDDAVQCESSLVTSAETPVVDDFTPLAHSSDKTKNSSASGVQNIDPKNPCISNRSISLSKCESEQKEKIFANYEVIATNPSLGEPLRNFIANDSQKVPQEALAQSKQRNEVKEEHCSQDRKEAIEDKSSAAASVEFVENPIKSKGFNPRQERPNYYLRGFNSQQEKDGFYQALVELGKQKTQVSSPVGWANNIIKDINAGGLCEYLFEYRRGEPLGMCEKQEWEIAPGQVYPRFLGFLRARLKTTQMSPQQSITAAHRALRNKGEASELWESFKRTVVNFADQWERDKAMGLSGAYVPPELLVEAEVTIDKAAKAMQLLESNSVQSNQSGELEPAVVSSVTELAGTQTEAASATDEQEEKLADLKAQIERMREFLQSGNAVKVTIARSWVQSNLDIVEPIKANGIIVDLSPREAFPVEESEAFPVEESSAEESSASPVEAHINVGDVCYYSGADYSMERLCKRYPLTVIAITGEMATVSAPKWYVTQSILLADLKLIE